LVHVHFWSAFLGLLVAVGAALAGGWQAGQQLANPAVSAAQVAAQSAPWALAGSLAALLLLVGHFAFALNAFGMILSSTTPTSNGRSD
jgi:cbb3-type cytochrome oxidase subunit 1